MIVLDLSREASIEEAIDLASVLAPAVLLSAREGGGDELRV